MGAQVMTSVVKNIIAGVLAVAAILGVAALFVDVTRNKGDGGDGKLIQEGGRATWGRSLEERDGPMTVRPEFHQANSMEIRERCGCMKKLCQSTTTRLPKFDCFILLGQSRPTAGKA